MSEIAECDGCGREGVTVSSHKTVPDGWTVRPPLWSSPDGLGELLCPDCVARAAEAAAAWTCPERWDLEGE